MRRGSHVSPIVTGRRDAATQRLDAVTHCGAPHESTTTAARPAGQRAAPRLLDGLAPEVAARGVWRHALDPGDPLPFARA